MANLFTSALSGMNAAQLGVATTEHNIANASTPGFTRQQIVAGSRAGQSTGAGFVGQGVDVSAVKRIYDQFLTTQVLQEQNQASFLTTYSTAMRQIDNLVADPAAGASPAMQSFFDAMNGVANNPQSVPARQALLSSAQFAVNRFQAIDQRLTDIGNGNTSQITGSIATINTYAQQIATLNGNIKRSISAGAGQQPNDLLDQRDQLVSKLSQEIKTTTLQQPDGTMAVFVGNGQALVIDETAMRLQAVQSTSDPSKVDVAYVNNGNIIPMQQSSLQGGNLGAYLTFRDQSLEPARNALGRVAMGLSASINQQNQLGQDLNGQAGSALFVMGLPRVDKSSSNTGTAAASATIANVSALTTSDYQLSFNGTNYSMLRMSDNTVTNLGAALPTNVTVDGFTFSLTAGANPGDSFSIRPTANGARDIALATNDPAKIAAALPLRASASIKATTASTTTTVASGAISGTVVSGVTTTAAVGTFTVDGNTLFTNTIAAGSTGTLITGAQLDSAWPAFSAANPGYTLTGTFAAGTAQITKANGTSIVLAEVNSGGAGGAISAFNAANPLFMGTTAGHATVASMTVATPTNANLTTPVTITFISPTQYNVTGAVPAPVNPVTYTAPNISYNGWTMQVAGTPVANDVINVAANSGAAKVSSGALNLNPVSINFTSATAYNVVEMRGVPPVAVTLGSGTYTAPGGGNISYNGWTVQIAGAPNTGDVFNITKGSNAGSMLAAPAATNAGAGTISGGTLSVQPFTITFNNPATSYTVAGATPAVAGAVPYTAGQEISYNGWTMQVTGTPVAGDVFSFATNSNAVGDNRNALMLATVQTQNLLANGTASLQGGYSQLVGQVGAKTNELAVTSLAQNNMVSQTVMSQQAVSGVNLDEEAANLMRYQKAYQAAAKAMQIANTMFDAVLALGR